MLKLVETFFMEIRTSKHKVKLFQLGGKSIFVIFILFYTRIVTNNTLDLQPLTTFFSISCFQIERRTETSLVVFVRSDPIRAARWIPLPLTMRLETPCHQQGVLGACIGRVQA